MEVPMVLELAATVLAAAYIGIVAFGHVLLVAAILKCLRDDRARARLQKAAADRAWALGETTSIPGRMSSRQSRMAVGGVEVDLGGLNVEHGQSSVSRENALLSFADQRQILSRDLQYVMAVTARHC
jgi:hypothetical protein